MIESRTMTDATWNHTSIIANDLEADVRRLKATPGSDITTLGSGSIAPDAAKRRSTARCRSPDLPSRINNSGHAGFAGATIRGLAREAYPCLRSPC